MEVILKQDVNKVGKAGSVVKVKDGYARNFLLRNGLAVPSNKENLKKMESEKEKRFAQAEKARKEAEGLKQRLSALSLTIASNTQEGDKLYGSITSQDIEKSLKEEGFDIDKSKIAIDEPIKSLGIYEIPVKLHPEVSAKIKLWIVKK